MLRVDELYADKAVLIGCINIGLLVVEEYYSVLTFSVVQIQETLESLRAWLLRESIVLRGRVEPMEVLEQLWVLFTQVVQHNSANVAKEVQDAASRSQLFQQRFHAFHRHLRIGGIDSTTLDTF